MRLVELKPEFLGYGGEGVSDKNGDSVPRREGIGVIFDCPCGNHEEEHRCYIPFANPIDGGPSVEPRGWQRTGADLETMSLTPSILRSIDKGGCGWHGFLRNGVFEPC